MSQSNVPALTITATGVTVPEAGEIQAGVLADYNSAFGGNLDIETVGSPQESLSEDTTEYVGDANAAIASLASQVDPNNAEGRMQDAIGRIYFLYRNGATASVVVGQCVGTPGATLPAGSLAQDTVPGQGFTWISLAAGTYGVGGTANVQFACQTLGPVTLPIGALTQILQAQPGTSWDSVTNLAAAVVGSNTESQSDFEYRRQNSVAANATGSPAAIFGAVAGVAGVTDCYVVDNPLGSVVNTGPTNYPMAANSIYIAAVGGTAQAICNAAWTKKSTGCNYNGTTTETVTDTSSLANPQPTYTVKYVQPAPLTIQIAVNLAANVNLPSNITALVQAAVQAAFNGQDGGQRARIASALYASRYYSGVAAISNAVGIVSIYIGSGNPGVPPTAGTVVNVGIDQVPTLALTDITVTT